MGLTKSDVGTTTISGGVSLGAKEIYLAADLSQSKKQTSRGFTQGLFSMSKGTSRRQFLRHAGIAAGLVASLARPAHAQTKLREVTLRLDWLFQGPNGGFMVAQDKGFYREVGLNVDIGPGKGSGSTAQLVASKATQFGFSDGFVVGLSVSKGMNIRTVGSFAPVGGEFIITPRFGRKPSAWEPDTMPTPTATARRRAWPSRSPTRSSSAPARRRSRPTSPTTCAQGTRTSSTSSCPRPSVNYLICQGKIR